MVFEPLQLLWMGIWLHPDAATTTNIPQDLSLRELLKIRRCKYANHATTLWLRL